MRRWALILAGGAVWLFLLALTAFADGGPHVASVNNGSAGVSSDNCAGCHRAHTAQAEYLLKHEVPDLCMSCHGTAGIGASTNVEDGVQYVPAGDGSRTGTVLGALRAGGFVNARIASGSAARLAYASGSNVRQLPKVPVAATGQAVTSTHMDVDSLAEATVWGNGALNSGAGGTTTLNCTSCHNPHGNGNYRILNPRPAGNGGTAIVASADALVTDGAIGTPDGTGRYPTRNYTVIQIQGTEGTDSSYLLYADQVVAGAYADTAGDYFHRRVPWNSSSGSNDAPNGKPSTFNAQITTWCSQCHTRYLTDPAVSLPQLTDSGDAIFAYRHGTTRTPCTTCHVVHGSNAQMTGFNSTHQYYPGEGDDPSATENTSSRLLKIDDRGTCQACHDPTGTIVAGTLVGPTPVPLVP